MFACVCDNGEQSCLFFWCAGCGNDGIGNHGKENDLIDFCNDVSTISKVLVIGAFKILMEHDLCEERKQIANRNRGRSIQLDFGADSNDADNFGFSNTHNATNVINGNTGGGNFNYHYNKNNKYVNNDTMCHH